MPVTDMNAITYLRRGRKLRSSGSVVERDEITRMTKVKPARDDWGMIWLDENEIQAGKEKPPIRPREPKDKPQESKPRQPRKKPDPPAPRWKQLVAEVRILESDHVPESWPPIKMHVVSALADELETAQAKLAEFLPMND